MSDYQWTVDSAVWQITHGGPTQRTLSAIRYIEQEIDDRVNVAYTLLDALLEQRGLLNLEDVLPDETETVEGQVNTNLDRIGNAIRNMKR